MINSPEDDKQSLLQYWRASGIITDARLLKAFSAIHRENFILAADNAKAYEDYPLPILCEQTISQPTTVMMMTQALNPAEGMKILEVGTGSGYQAAILSRLVGHQGRIISVEYHSELADFAGDNLGKAGCTNVSVINSDGGRGVPEDAPYDRIIVTCTCPEVPPPLLTQLKTGGIMVLPVQKYLYDEIFVINKSVSGVGRRSLGSFRFVPLLGEYGQKRK